MKKKTAYLGIMLALALICSYVEALIPIPLGIPGIKLGLANIVIVFALYSMGIKEALLLSVMRVTISGFMFGNVVAIAYSLTGGLLSLLVMYLLKKTEVPVVIAECGFLSNSEDAQKLVTEEYQQELARALTDGILEYIKDNAGAS